ncbi:MAG: DNA repair protein RecO [Candidatus Saccharibacteria bacterium]|nr:DNA repair protein RecO [Candidatus Saccharibacteria bacterium]
MSHLTTRAIVLRRTNYQEADRILTVLTKDQGKLSVMAKGVRKSKSKLAGGIELFAVNDLTLLTGRSDLRTLTSSRVHTQFGDIVKDIDRTMKAYDYLKLIDKIADENHDQASEYFGVLTGGLEGLNDLKLDHHLVDVWFYLHVLDIFGAVPDLRRDTAGNSLDESKTYDFNVADMQFAPAENGTFTAPHIKLLRVALTRKDIKKLSNIYVEPTITLNCSGLCRKMIEHNLL